METSARVTRTTMIAAIFLVALMLGVPSAITGGKQMAATDNAAAADGTRLFIVGGLDFTNAVATLSPFKYTSAQEMMTIWPCLSTLLTYDVNSNLIGDIADSWTMSPDGLTWSFKMQSNIYFTDPLTPTVKTHQLTWLDIQYTYFQTQNSTNGLSMYFDYAGSPVIKRIWGDVASNWVNITLNMPYAPILSSLTFVPIIPKYYWQPHENAQGYSTGWTGALPVGSGPWYYPAPGLPTTGEVELRRAPNWFQETDRGWQVHVDSLKYRSETDAATAWMDLKLGNIDVFMAVPPSMYVNDLPTEPTLVGWAQSTGFVYEYNINGMGNTMRSQLGPPYNSGSSNQILQDPIVRRAMAMAVNKPRFVTDVLNGLGTKADSLVPDVNPWYYSPQNQVSFDLTGANALLQANGYQDIDSDGVRECTASSPAVMKYGVALNSEMSFKFATLDSATEWQQGATLIRDDTAQIGVKLTLTINTYNQMSQFWMKADYDAWLWDWMFTPLSDPSTDILSVMTTDAIATGWQDVYWSNATYDEVYNRSLVAMDPSARRELTNQLQQLGYDSYNCQLVAYRKELYAAYKGEWGGYGNWQTNFLLMPDQLAPYLYMQISPNGTGATNPNTAPKITSLATSVTADKGVSKAFTGSATDAPTTTLNYQWFWGDSTAPSGWSTSSGANHVYAKDGYYTAYFAVKEANTADGFITVKAVKVTVNDNTNTAPHSLGIAISPTSPNTGTTIAFTASATDDQSDPLYYSWNFGDTYTGTGATPTHRYTIAGSYSVTLSVTDNHVSTQPRPVTTTLLVSVSANRQPTISVPAYPYVGWKINTAFTVTANDPDGDALRYTFLWGDGDRTVTSSPSATHAYQQKGVFTLTVYADDLTGLAGHNASGSNTVNVVTPVAVSPVISVFSASTLTAEVGQAITFTGTASDGNGGILKMTFQYTGTPNAYDVRTSGSLVAGALYTQTTTHSYASPGTKSVSLYVLDDTGNNVTVTPITLNIVVPNQPPEVTPLSPYSGVTGTTITFVGDAYDPDNAVLRYTWSFGDGSALKVGQSVGYAYAKPGTWTVTLYVDDLTGLAGHNVSTSATATIGWRLVLTVGWNLISLPMTTSYTANTLPGLTTGDEVVNWNPATQTYDKIFIKGVSPPIMNYALVANSGYWVYVTAAKTLTLYGTVPTDQQSRVVTVPATGGWVLIGFCSMNTGWHAANLASMYSGASITTVVRYAPGIGYTTHIIGVPMNNFLLVPGSGYWIFVSGSGTWTYSP